MELKQPLIDLNLSRLSKISRYGLTSRKIAPSKRVIRTFEVDSLSAQNFEILAIRYKYTWDELNRRIIDLINSGGISLKGINPDLNE